MSPRKPTKKNPVIPVEIPTTAGAVTEPPARPKDNLVDLAKRSLALRDQHAAPTPRDGFGRPIQQAPTKAVRYMVQYDDGTVLYAEDDHADVIYRYIQECEQLCSVRGLAYYDGPGMEKITLDALRARLAR